MLSFFPCAPQGRFPAAFMAPLSRARFRSLLGIRHGRQRNSGAPRKRAISLAFSGLVRSGDGRGGGLAGRNLLPTTDPRLRATDPLESKWPSPAPRTAVPCSRDAIPLPARRDSPASADRSPAPADRSPASTARTAGGSMPPEQGIDASGAGDGSSGAPTTRSGAKFEVAGANFGLRAPPFALPGGLPGARGATSRSGGARFGGR